MYACRQKHFENWCVYSSVCVLFIFCSVILCLCIQHIWISPRHCCKHWIIKFSVGYTIYVFMYFIAHRISSVVYSLNPNYIKFSVHCVMIALPDGTLCSYHFDIYLYLYLCLCFVYIYIYTHVPIDVCIYMYIHTYVCVCIYTHICIHAYTYIYTHDTWYICIYKYVFQIYIYQFPRPEVICYLDTILGTT